jgi:hypothetical protein
MLLTLDAPTTSCAGMPFDESGQALRGVECATQGEKHACGFCRPFTTELC